MTERPTQLDEQRRFTGFFLIVAIVESIPGLIRIGTSLFRHSSDTIDFYNIGILLAWWVGFVALAFLPRFRLLGDSITLRAVEGFFLYQVIRITRFILSVAPLEGPHGEGFPAAIVADLIVNLFFLIPTTAVLIYAALFSIKQMRIGVSSSP